MHLWPKRQLSSKNRPSRYRIVTNDSNQQHRYISHVPELICLSNGWVLKTDPADIVTLWMDSNQQHRYISHVPEHVCPSNAACCSTCSHYNSAPFALCFCTCWRNELQFCDKLSKHRLVMLGGWYSLSVLFIQRHSWLDTFWRWCSCAETCRGRNDTS